MTSFITFKLPGEYGKLRGTITDDHSQVFSVYDFIFKARECEDKGFIKTKNILEMLRKPSGKYAEQLSWLIYQCKVFNSGEIKTPCMTVEGLMILMHILGNIVSATFKQETIKVFERYNAGDTTMCETDAERRQKTPCTLTQTDDERKMIWDEKKIKHSDTKLDLVSKALDILDSVNSRSDFDIQTKKRFEEHIMGILF